jgi:hypothetical protein
MASMLPAIPPPTTSTDDTLTVRSSLLDFWLRHGSGVPDCGLVARLVFSRAGSAQS